LAARRISMKVKVAIALVALTALATFGLRKVLFHKILDEDDERPPIIVHNGSLVFENEKNWKKDPSRLRYKLDHPRGKTVGSYSVVMIGSSTAACIGKTLSGTEVLVDYRADSAAAVKQFHLQRAWQFAMPPGTLKREPALDSTETMTIVAGTGTTPSQLIYAVGPEGWISNVTVSDPSGPISCAFPQPPNPAARAAVKVEITPIP
jgi:hypothetical protein